MEFASKTDERVIADSVLDPDVRFPHPVSPHAFSPRAACLTGATGFLGGYLLHELLTKTGTEAFCLVRGANAFDALERLVRHLEGHGLWHEAFRGRVHAVPVRDLAEPRFGLGDDAFHELAASTDVIYHSAGSLNMAFPYERLRGANVAGTIEVLRLAAAVRTKPVHFLSSMVVFFTDAHLNDELLRETDPPRFHPTLRGGYSKSKWVADRLVAAAQNRGLPATIHRPVRTMGTAATGAMNDLSDVLPLLLKACILLGHCPELDIKVTMVPVDFVTSSMVHLAARRESCGKAFHYFHPAPVSWSRLTEIVRALGYPLRKLSYPDWKGALKRRVSDDGETPARKAFFAAAFLAMTAPHFLFYRRPPLDCRQLMEGLRGTGLACPEIDEALIGTYLAYWRTIGFLPDPQEP